MFVRLAPLVASLGCGFGCAGEEGAAPDGAGGEGGASVGAPSPAAGGTGGPGAGGNGAGGQGNGAVGQGGAGSAASPLYVKPSKPGAGDLFGVALALAADGNTLAVGANREASSGGNPDDDSLADAGAVYVFARAEDSFREAALLKASNAGMGDGFGSSVALSLDGSTLAVGAPFESSPATGIDGEQNDDSLPDAGAVYVFARGEGGWQQQAYVKASNTGDDDLFGISVALSADGNVLAVGAEGEDSSATGVDGDQSDKSLRDAGAVYVFERTLGIWQQAAYVKASNTDRADHFGGVVALSSDGRTLAVGAYFEDGAGSGTGADPEDDSAESAGAAYLFTNDGGWQQAAYLKPTPNDGAGYDGFGSSVSLSADGTTLVVGAAGDDSAAAGIDGAPGDGSIPYAGAAYVFVHDGSTWSQRAYLKASNPGAGDEFGYHLSLAADGRTLAVGAALEDSSGTGVGAAADDLTAGSGAVYLFGSDGISWQERAFIKAPNTGAGDRFGWSLGLDVSGSVLVVGASREASGNAADPNDDSAGQAGAVYVYPTLPSVLH